jgi:predicted DNA-binding transcriptional regulator YafY
MQSMKTGTKPLPVTAGRQQLTHPALERIYFIDQQIASGKYPNTEKLRQLCMREYGYGKLSQSTISRDIAFLKDRLNAPIEYDAFERGYYYSDKTFRLPAGFGSSKDLMALALAKSILTMYKETPLYDAAENLLESLMTASNSSGDSSHDWLENRIAVPQIALAKIDEKAWKTITAALRKNEVLLFDYQGIWDDEYHSRRVEAWQLLFLTKAPGTFTLMTKKKKVCAFSTFPV